MELIDTFTLKSLDAVKTANSLEDKLSKLTGSTFRLIILNSNDAKLAGSTFEFSDGKKSILLKDHFYIVIQYSLADYKTLYPHLNWLSSFLDIKHQLNKSRNTVCSIVDYKSIQNKKLAKPFDKKVQSPQCGKTFDNGIKCNKYFDYRLVKPAEWKLLSQVFTRVDQEYTIMVKKEHVMELIMYPSSKNKSHTNMDLVQSKEFWTAWKAINQGFLDKLGVSYPYSAFNFGSWESKNAVSGHLKCHGHCHLYLSCAFLHKLSINQIVCMDGRIGLWEDYFNEDVKDAVLLIELQSQVKTVETKIDGVLARLSLLESSLSDSTINGGVANRLSGLESSLSDSTIDGGVANRLSRLESSVSDILRILKSK